MTRIVAIILASLSVGIVGARGQDSISCGLGFVRYGDFCVPKGTLSDKSLNVTILTPSCAAGWLPVKVGDQTWCARELRAPGGQ